SCEPLICVMQGAHGSRPARWVRAARSVHRALARIGCLRPADILLQFMRQRKDGTLGLVAGAGRVELGRDTTYRRQYRCHGLLLQPSWGNERFRSHAGGAVLSTLPAMPLVAFRQD